MMLFSFRIYDKRMADGVSAKLGVIHFHDYVVLSLQCLCVFVCRRVNVIVLLRNSARVIWSAQIRKQTSRVPSSTGTEVVSS